MASFSAIVIGNESLAVQCSEKLLARGNDLRAVVTRNPDVAAWARDHAIRVIDAGPDLDARIAGLRCDWLLSIANLDIIPASVLDLPAKGAVNFHDGPLPRHAGLNAPVWALIEGEARHGVTWHMIVGGVDEGDILLQRNFDIAPTDTALTLNTKCFEAAINSFDALQISLESGAPERTPQDLSQRSYHALADRPSNGGLLDFTRPAEVLDRLVRALDHGPYWNPLCTAKICIDGACYSVGSARPGAAQAVPGTVLAVTQTDLTLACDPGALILSDLRDSQGAPVSPADLVQLGAVLETPEIATPLEDLARHDGFWRARLAAAQPATLTRSALPTGRIQTQAVTAPVTPAHVALWAARLVAEVPCDLALSTPALCDRAQSGLVSPWVPLRTSDARYIATLADDMTAGIATAQTRVGFARDLMLRDPALSAHGLPQIGLSQSAGMIPGTVLSVEISDDSCTLYYDAGAIDAEYAALLAARLEHLATIPDDAPLDGIATLPTRERDLVLTHWNATDTDHDSTLTMHRAFEAQVARTPETTALVFENQSLSYADLNARANRVAHVLQSMGVGADKVVGLCTRRSVDMMVGALAILKAGGAYLPMDPGYPRDRLAHFAADSGAAVIVTQAGLDLPEHGAEVLALDSDARIADAADTNLPDVSGPENLAYLIYTSGSTGLPKGVMIEHRNVANFYAGMDQRVAHDGGTWLAVTSLSFDISVLELFYATARGFKVVLTSDADRGLISNGPLPRVGGMEFSLYYWGNDDGVGPDKYKTLLKGAKFGDEHGFVAVWTPERHFHAFGGPYPNPSVTGAAVAAITKNIGVRAGSCVAPLHHPARIAEEWAVIDNLTNGRAGMAIASGWQPDDFVLRPENTPPNNKPAMIDTITTLRQLWAGAPVEFARQDGSMHAVITQPRPVSRELPVWVTTAGNPETWKEAGRLGANVLTHLLGQSVDEVAAKIKIYHTALREAGFDPANYIVTLMLHTCLAATREEAREIAREPMKDYLRSAAGLIKQYAWAFPAFKKPEGVKNPFELDLGSLSPEELEGILDFAFERYFNDSGMFGTIEDALARTEELKKIGVGEIACLIDYGIDADVVLEGLKPLAEVLQRANEHSELPEDDFSIAAQILRQDVTHLQCTPSMARMIAMNDEARQALGRVQHLMLGGEPLPGTLVADFNAITDATITNMYGPTETTIWSSSAPAVAGDGTVDIGLPIANTQFYVLDGDLQPVGVGQPGELWIGGDGVARGYWNRPDLTADRFVANPFHDGRMYRTGDLVARRADGRIDFIGRVDHQIKLRGHRIELGEIESALEAQSGIRQAVVLAREDQPGDVRLVGYFTSDSLRDEARLKVALGAALPDYMVPVRFVRLDAFPLTPNKKVDRAALPAPKTAVTKPTAKRIVPVATAKPSGDVEGRIGAIWARVLGVDTVSGRDSFFDLGGHSLLAVQAHRLIREELGTPALSITDIFRFPVLSALAGRVAALIAPADATARVPKSPSPAATLPPTPRTPPITPLPGPPPDRAQARSDAMARRRAMRARRFA